MMVINHLQVLAEPEEKEVERRPVSFAAVHVLGGAAWTQAPYGHWVSGVGYLECSAQKTEAQPASGAALASGGCSGAGHSGSVDFPRIVHKSHEKPSGDCALERV